MKIAGLDIGTTGCKCTVFDEQGRYLNKAYKDYPVRRNPRLLLILKKTVMNLPISELTRQNHAITPITARKSPRRSLSAVTTEEFSSAARA